jgi:molybdenum cofactor cytidylyltransferase
VAGRFGVSLGAIVLAAGASTRLGTPKQLLDGPRGPLVQATIAAARDAGATPVVVTLGAHAARIAPHCTGALVVPVPDWAEGQHASLAAGLAALEAAAPTLEGAYLLVCDQPALTADVLVRLHDAFRRTGADAAAAFYHGQAGVPALVAARLFARVRERSHDRSLSGAGDRGARALLRDPAVRTALVEWPDGAFDIDTPADAARLAATASRPSPA